MSTPAVIESWGDFSLYLALFGVVVAIPLMLLGIVKSNVSLQRWSRRSLLLGIAGVWTAIVAMEVALLTNQFAFDFVRNSTATDIDWFYTITALWSGLEGSLMLWTGILGALVAVVILTFRRDDRVVVSWALLILAGVLAWFVALVALVLDPFATALSMSNGSGPNPLLGNHPLMAIHPPILYLGYVGFSVPFAFAAGALLAGESPGVWQLRVRKWTLATWAFLSAGVVLGAWWSYEVLGWGGYWAWDPVENASILPWLTATAYLHSLMAEDRRGILKPTNFALLAATFSLVLLGTYLTRSGSVQSVHAFSISTIGPWLLLLAALVAIGSIVLMMWRQAVWTPDRVIGSLWSREVAFLALNVLLGLMAVVVFAGTLFPLVVDRLRGESLTIGAPYFVTMLRPLGLVLLLALAVGPWLKWGQSSAAPLRRELLIPACAGAVAMGVAVLLRLDERVVEGSGIWFVLGIGFAVAALLTSVIKVVKKVRANGRRALIGRHSGGMVAHLGLVVLALGLMSTQSFLHRTEVTAASNSSFQRFGHEFQILGLEMQVKPVTTTQRVRVLVDGVVRAPTLTDYARHGMAIGKPSVLSTWRHDVYLTLAQKPQENQPITLGIMILPGAPLLWVGGGLLVLGAALSLARKSSHA